MSEKQKKQGALLSAAEIFAADDLSHAEVEVPEWTPAGEATRSIRLRQLSAGEAIAFTESVQANAASRNQAMVRIIRDSAVNADGSLMFDGDGDMERLRGKSFVVFQRLQDAAMLLNGFTSKDDDDEDAGDTAAKNG